MDKSLIELLDKITSDKELVLNFSSGLKTGKHLNITGLCNEQKVYVAMALSRLAGRKAVFIEPDSARARSTAAYCAAFTDAPVTLLMPSELSLVSAEASSRELELTRSAALSELVRGSYGAAVITSGALLNKLEPKNIFTKRIIKLKVGAEMERDELVAALTLNGYENVPQVMEKGEFSVRGDIVDIYSPSYTEPVRISFFDTEIDQIKTFDRETQRSTGQLEETEAVPASILTVNTASPVLHWTFLHSSVLTALIRSSTCVLQTKSTSSSRNLRQICVRLSLPLRVSDNGKA